MSFPPNRFMLLDARYTSIVSGARHSILMYEILSIPNPNLDLDKRDA